MAKRQIDNPATELFNNRKQAQPPQAPTRQVNETLADSPAPARKNLTVEIQEVGEPLVIALNREPRTQRKQFLLPPSVCNQAEAKCKRLGISMNEAINQLLAKWVDTE